MPEKYEREWYRAVGGQVISEIINRAGIAVSTKYCPVQGGYSWVSGEFSSDSVYSEPYEALLQFIVWSVQKGHTKQVILSSKDLIKELRQDYYLIHKDLLPQGLTIQKLSDDSYRYAINREQSDDDNGSGDVALLFAIDYLLKENRRLNYELDDAIQEELGLE